MRCSRLVWVGVLVTSVATVVPCSAQSEVPTHGTVVIEAQAGLGGMALGDLDPTTAGAELVAVSGNGQVWLAYTKVGKTGADRFGTRCIHHGRGELIMGAIGDVDPRHPGNEFVGVGMVDGPESLAGPGQAVMVSGSGDNWQATPIFQDDHMIHGVAIGDVSARHPGQEVITAGFNHRVTLLHFEAGRFVPEVIYTANDRLKIAAVGDLLPERDGLEVAVCSSDGTAVVLWETDLGWKHQVLYEGTAGQSRLAVIEGGLLVGGDDGTVVYIHRVAKHWRTEFLFRDAHKIRGTAVGDVDPERLGEEFYVCGYSRVVTQLWHDLNGMWVNRPIFTAPRPLHHLLIGDFDPTQAGVELYTCGHDGKVWQVPIR
jgi:hypothetical protein